MESVPDQVEGALWHNELTPCSNVMVFYPSPCHDYGIYLGTGLMCLTAPHKRWHIFFLFLHKNICGELRKIPCLIWSYVAFLFMRSASRFFLPHINSAAHHFTTLYMKGILSLDLHECWAVVAELANNCMIADVSILSEIIDVQCWTLKAQITTAADNILIFFNYIFFRENKVW